MPITIQTEKPIAVDSPDHQYPLGTAQDNSTDPIFNKALFSLIPAHDVRLLDIGCSGGGFVKSILDAGGFAVGVEGSDYSQKRRRAEWATIPEHLFTADATVPFQLSQDGEPLKFNVITAWEFLEHIADADLDGVFANIHRHLAPQGIVITSVCPISCLHTGKMHTGESTGEGVELHQTAQPESWWRTRLADAGFMMFDEIKPCFKSFVRGFPRDPDSPVLIFTTPQIRRIPRLFHQLWQDENSESSEVLANKESWQYSHPDWEWRVWTAAELAAFGSIDANALRVEILRRHGGVFPDLSLTCRQSLEPELADITGFDSLAGTGATLGGIAGHPLFDKQLSQVSSATIPEQTQIIPENGCARTAIPLGRLAEFQASPAPISVCVPAMGNAAQLDRCVESILNQTFKDFQILILTSASETFAVASALAEADPRIVAAQCAESISSAEALNLCLELTGGDYVQFVASTDILRPEILGRHIAALQRYEHVVVSASAFEVSLDNGEKAPQKPFDRTLLLPTESALSHAILNAGTLSHASPLMFRRESIIGKGLRFDTEMQWASVYDLVLRLLAFGDLAYLHEMGCVISEATALPLTSKDQHRHFQEVCAAMRNAVSRTAYTADTLGHAASQVAGVQQDLLRTGLRGHTLGEILTDTTRGVTDGGKGALLDFLTTVRQSLTSEPTALRLTASSR
jgi:SAM-dependent methyltransferase